MTLVVIYTTRVVSQEKISAIESDSRNGKGGSGLDCETRKVREKRLVFQRFSRVFRVFRPKESGSNQAKSAEINADFPRSGVY